jgi:hypothetical protein
MDAAAWIAFFLAWGLLAALLGAAGVAPGVPYNVRELFAGPRGWATALALPLVWGLWAGVPAAAAWWIGGGSRRRAALLPALAIGCALLAFGLLRHTVSVESIWDIVGYPVLHGPGDWEIGGRFVALFATIWMLIAGGAAAALAVDSRDRRGALARWLPWAIAVVVPGYLVIVPWAATDNLTELIRGGGAIGGAVAIAGWLLVVGCAASLASRAVAMTRAEGSFGRWGIAAAAAVISLPAGYLLATLGTADRIEKYGSTFSAIQFLLSPDREHYVSGAAILALYALAHALAWVGIALVQLPAWLAARNR